MHVAVPVTLFRFLCASQVTEYPARTAQLASIFDIDPSVRISGTSAAPFRWDIRGTATICSFDGGIHGAINCGPAGVGENPQRDDIKEGNQKRDCPPFVKSDATQNFGYGYGVEHKN
jgi:hypothetical protein